jgi:hypothetical protein
VALRREASGPLLGHSGLPERTSTRAYRIVKSVGTMGTMIEHADAALAAWFATLDPPVDVSFDRPLAGEVTDAAPTGASGAASGGKRSGARPTLQLSLANVREQRDKRDNQVDEIRDAGRVVGLQKATRFFELDYLCSVAGEVRHAHRALGELLQLFVDHDVVPASFVPEELQALGHPIEIHLVASAMPGAALTLRLVLPVRPTVSSDVGPPTRSLHLDMAEPPDRSPGLATVAPVPDLPPIGERRWTTVRRRELIGSQHSVSERHDTTGTRERGA